MIINSGNTTSEIESEVSNWVNSAYDDLVYTFILAAIAIFVAFIGLCIFSAAVSNKSAYVFKDTTPKKFHYGFLIGIMLSAIYKGFSLGTTNIPLYIIACILSGIAIMGLFHFKLYGLISSLLFLWTIGFASQLNGIFAVNYDRLTIGGYSTPGKVAVYTASDYAIKQTIIIGVFMLVLSIFIVIYYSHRRYLFKAYRTLTLNSISTCTHCGMPIMTKMMFCTNCGIQLDANFNIPVSFKVLDTKKYCKKCGNFIDKTLGCVKCAAIELKNESLAVSIKRGIISGLKKAVAKIMTSIALVVIIFAVVFIPGMKGDFLRADVVKVNNVYVEKLNEFYENPDISKDETWLVGFNSASDALYAVNKQCFYINPSAVRLDDILFYAMYSEASFDQMVILEKMQNAINKFDYSQTDQLMIAFDNTIDEKIKAAETIFRQSSDGNIIFQIGKICTNGIRLYISFFNINVLLYAIFVLGIISVTASLIKYNAAIVWLSSDNVTL
jgi:hypothetical protein